MNAPYSVSELDALQPDDLYRYLFNAIAQLAPTQKTVLAMYYHENFQLAEIAACFGLTERQIDQIRAEALGLLQTMLATQIGLAKLPARFDRARQMAQVS